MFPRWLSLRVLAVVLAIVVLFPAQGGAVAGFGDVPASEFYSDAVQWLALSGITTGTSATCFSPEQHVTRGQAAAFIWRMEGRLSAAPHPFRDVTASWQRDAVGWMFAEGITTGTTPTTFGPEQVLTRAQIATFLHRLAGEPPAGGLPFGDLTAPWQQEPVAWMAATGLTTGTSSSTFSPDDTVTRAQLATFLHRYQGRPAAVFDASSPACNDASLISQLAPLVAPLDPSRARYDRDRFFEGGDLDGDCVRTRHEVLQEEALEYSMAGCLVDAGVWFDPFTATSFSDPHDLQVDHVVALADAWRSGAWKWSDGRRELFANDLINLNAIGAAENQRKSDSGPAGYRPSNAAQTCAYLAQYGSVKVAYGLAITQADFDALSTRLDDCSSFDPAKPGVLPPATTTVPATDCHPAYSPCLPNRAGDVLNCGDLSNAQKPVTVLDTAVDPYGLDGDNDGIGCEG
jgi:hypothetical protein